MSARWILETPPGSGGLALIALRGPGARAALARLTREPPPRCGRLRLTELRRAGQVLDEALIACIPDPCSPDAAEAFELGLHGGPAVVRAVVEALEEVGVAAGSPGPPCWLSGGAVRRAAAARLDEAWSAPASQLLLRALNGELEARLMALRGELRSDPEAARARTRGFLAEFAWSRLLMAPASVALVGAPNAGKSTLFNALLGERRALTSERPGTTRDFLEEELILDGWPLRLVDTAGLRRGEGGPERQGIALGRGRARRADLRLWAVDGAAPGWGALPEEPWIGVLTKADLLSEEASAALRARAPGGADRWPAVSAQERSGLAELGAAVRARLAPTAPPSEAAPAAIFTDEQAAALEAVLAALEDGAIARADAAIASILD